MENCGRFCSIIRGSILLLVKRGEISLWSGGPLVQNWSCDPARVELASLLGARMSVVPSLAILRSATNVVELCGLIVQNASVPVWGHA